MKIIRLKTIVAIAAAIFVVAHGAESQERTIAIKWGEITGTVYGAAVHCRVSEDKRERFLDAVSAKIALNALNHADRRAAAEEFIRFKRLSQSEPERGCLDLRQDFDELVAQLKTTSYGWQWQSLANEKLERRKWKP